MFKYSFQDKKSCDGPRPLLPVVSSYRGHLCWPGPGGEGVARGSELMHSENTEICYLRSFWSGSSPSLGPNTQPVFIGVRQTPAGTLRLREAEQ